MWCVRARVLEPQTGARYGYVLVLKVPHWRFEIWVHSSIKVKSLGDVLENALVSTFPDGVLRLV